MKRSLRDLAKVCGIPWTLLLERDIPRHWEVHGDLTLFPEGSFRKPEWRLFPERRWAVVAEALGCRRLARRSRIQPDDFRSPRVDFLLGDDSWVEHVDNHIRYSKKRKIEGRMEYCTCLKLVHSRTGPLTYCTCPCLFPSIKTLFPKSMSFSQHSEI